MHYENYYNIVTLRTYSSLRVLIHGKNVIFRLKNVYD